MIYNGALLVYEVRYGPPPYRCRSSECLLCKHTVYFVIYKRLQQTQTLIDWLSEVILGLIFNCKKGCFCNTNISLVTHGWCRNFGDSLNCGNALLTGSWSIRELLLKWSIYGITNGYMYPFFAFLYLRLLALFYLNFFEFKKKDKKS